MFKKSQTVSIDIDPQNSYTMMCPGEMPVDDSELVAPALNTQSTFAKFRVLTKETHAPGSRWVSTESSPAYTRLYGNPDFDLSLDPHNVVGTFGARLIDNLPSEEEYDHVVWRGHEPHRHPYGACFHDHAGTMSTGLIEWLQVQGVKNCILGGMPLEYGVKHTALQLKAAGFEVAVNFESSRGIWKQTMPDDLLAELLLKGIHVVYGSSSLTSLVDSEGIQ